MRQSLRLLSFTLCVFVLFTPVVLGQQFSTSITSPYRVIPNITYLKANNFDAKLDVYTRSDVTSPQPTVIFIHGGGWTAGSKESVIFELMTYMEQT